MKHVLDILYTFQDTSGLSADVQLDIRAFADTYDIAVVTNFMDLHAKLSLSNRFGLPFFPHLLELSRVAWEILDRVLLKTILRKLYENICTDCRVLHDISIDVSCKPTRFREMFVRPHVHYPNTLQISPSSLRYYH